MCCSATPEQEIGPAVVDKPSVAHWKKLILPEGRSDSLVVNLYPSGEVIVHSLILKNKI